MRRILTFMVSLALAYLLYECMTKWLVVFLSSMSPIKAVHQTASALFNNHIGELITTMPYITIAGSIVTALILTKTNQRMRY